MRARWRGDRGRWRSRYKIGRRTGRRWEEGQEDDGTDKRKMGRTRGRWEGQRQEEDGKEAKRKND